jgi:hypothetical protein
VYTQVSLESKRPPKVGADGQSNSNPCRSNRLASIWRPQIGKKGAALYAAISQHQTVNIRQISQNWAEQNAYYRFLENEQVTRSELVRSLSDHCEQQVEGRHVLAISDTSEINLQAHAGRLKAEGVGVVGNNRDVGCLVQRTLRRPQRDCIRFFMHPTLAMDAQSGFPLGLSNVQIWTRALERPNKTERKYKTLPIEKKESYKWLAAAERSYRCFQVG